MKSAQIVTIAAGLALAAVACSKNDAGNDLAINASQGEEATVGDTLGMNQAGVKAAATPMTPGGFANAVAVSNLFEIESAKLAASKASSAEIRALAQQLLADHQKSSMELTATTARASPPVTVMPALDADKQAMLDQLKAAGGADFDRRFIDQQTNAHQQALVLLQDYLGNGDSLPLKEFASRARTMVQDHLEHLNGIRK